MCPHKEKAMSLATKCIHCHSVYLVTEPTGIQQVGSVSPKNGTLEHELEIPVNVALFGNQVSPSTIMLRCRKISFKQTPIKPTVFLSRKETQEEAEVGVVEPWTRNQ